MPTSRTKAAKPTDRSVSAGSVSAKGARVAKSDLRNVAPRDVSNATRMLRELQTDLDALNLRIEKLRERVA